jgi:squalene-hopene/tetraprenyl-beta-curcumene cyclase
VLGTSRVLRAFEVLDRNGAPAARGVEYLLRSENVDGGWGGAKDVASSVEETALAVAALAPWAQTPATGAAFVRGVGYLVSSVARPPDRPAPIGLYFAHLWYSEQLYPLVWTLDALARAAKAANSTGQGVGSATISTV